MQSVEPIAVLGDPTRRAIFERLAEGPCSVAELARHMPVTRPAVSQHLGVLKEAGLVTHQTEGTRHVYRIDPEGIAAIHDYLDRLWERALADFKAVAERSYKEKKQKMEKEKKQ